MEEGVFYRSSKCESSHCMEVGWTQSSYCEAGACIEVDHTHWSESRCETGHCVEVGLPTQQQVLMRDSKDPGGPILTFSPHAWNSFVGMIKQQ